MTGCDGTAWQRLGMKGWGRVVMTVWVTAGAWYSMVGGTTVIFLVAESAPKKEDVPIMST